MLFDERRDAQGVSRRDFLWQSGGGLGGIALAALLPQNSPAAVERHHRPRAKRVVQFYMSGAASQCDLFDYKPALVSRHGQQWDPGEEVELFQSSPGKVMRAPWKWRRCGESAH